MNNSSPPTERARGTVVWLTGLPASGKTTIARRLQAEWGLHGYQAVLLDSDRLREVLTPTPTYAPTERDRFYAALVGLAALLTDQGVPVIIAATGHLRRYRQAARDRLERFIEVLVDCPLEVCRARDPKGLYTKAGKEQDNTLPGMGVSFEVPQQPDLILHSDQQSVDRSVKSILDVLTTRGWMN